jgi:hypothetical protein
VTGGPTYVRRSVGYGARILQAFTYMSAVCAASTSVRVPYAPHSRTSHGANPQLGRKAAWSVPPTEPHIVAAPPGPKGNQRFAEPCSARLYAAGRVGVHAYGQACRRMREVRRRDPACEIRSQRVRRSAPLSSGRWVSLTVLVTVAADGARHVAIRLLERVRAARVTA